MTQLSMRGPRMARMRLRAVAGAVALAVVALLALATARPAGAASEAYFVFTDGRQEAVIKLTDPAEIQHARDLINGETTEMPGVMGTIVKQPAPYNPGWSYHLDPETIEFFDIAIEVCDAGISYVEEHLDEAGDAFLPDLRWCPWASRLVSETTP